MAANDLSVRLGDRTILTEVSFAVGRGEFVGLVGPNGAGKTTLLRALVGLVVPASGKVSYDGRPLSAVRRDERARRVAALFQGEAIGWPMRVAEIVALGRLPYRRTFAGLTPADRDAVARAMRRTGVDHLVDRAGPSLSSGERMRVLLARALAVEAEMLLADEPITALDPAHQIEVMTLLRDVARRGTGVVAVLHDLTLAARFCDRLVVLDRGRVGADDRPDASLSDRILTDVFEIWAARGRHADGTDYLLPWARLAPTERKERR